MILSGCTHNLPTSNTEPPTDETKSIIDKSNTIHTNISAKVKDIQDSIGEIESKVSLSIRTGIQKYLDSIKTDAIVIQSQTDKIKEDIIPAAQQATTQSLDIAKERDKYKKAYIDEKAKNDSGLRKFLWAVAGLAFLFFIGGIAGAIFAPSPYKKYGTAVAGLSAFTCGAAIAFNKYETIIAICALCIVIIFIVYLVFILWKNRNEIFAQENTNVRLVQLGEIIKAELTKLGEPGIQLRERIFGDGGIAQVVLRGPSQAEQKINFVRKSGKVKLTNSLDASTTSN